MVSPLNVPCHTVGYTLQNCRDSVARVVLIWGEGGTGWTPGKFKKFFEIRKTKTRYTQNFIKLGQLQRTQESEDEKCL